MSSYKDFDNLRKAILVKAKKGMKEEVLPNYIVDVMRDAIKRRVYDVYPFPRGYKRRKEDDGLLDKDNIVGKVDKSKEGGFTFKVENVARTNFPLATSPSIYLAPLVIMGKNEISKSYVPARYDYWEGSERLPYGEPRDFISGTKDSIDMNVMSEKLEKYMNNH